jgi:hypothetical protein
MPVLSQPSSSSAAANPQDLRERSWLPSGALAANFVRPGWNGTNASITSGTMRLIGGIVLPANVAINSISLAAGGTGAGTPTHQWFCLVKASDLSVLGKTVNDTTTAWATQTVKTLALSATYTPTSDTVVYVGVVVVAATPPNLSAHSVTFGWFHSTAPKLSADSTSGLTDPASLGATAAALGSSVDQIPLTWVS